MDEAAREGRPAMTAAADESGSEQKSPEELRQDIEHTREELGDTVEALAEKTDIKAQAKNRISAVKETAQQKKDEFAAKTRQATPESASAGAQQIAATVQRKPLPFATAGAFAAGVLIGWLAGRR
jgi:chromosome segregation ATPase